MSTLRLVAIEVAIGVVLSIAACVGLLYAIGNDGTGPLIEGASVFIMSMGIGLLGIILAFLGDEQLTFLFFVVPASMAFGIAALIANLLTHLVIARATPPAAAATP